MRLEIKPETDLYKAGLKAVQILHSAGFQAFWVGGVVRNHFLHLESDNLDIATNALPDQVVLLLSKQKIYIKPVGKQFGSILAVIDGQKIEITTFRKEGFYSDNRHPDKVEFIQEFLPDARRRDFTINSLYYDPATKELFDPMKGLVDLKKKLLRFVGDPKKRIDEDALRMLRAVRLSTQLEFRLEKNSFAAIKTRAKYIQGISSERIKAELDKLILSPNRAEGLRLMDDAGLLKFILPEFVALKKFSHKSKHYHLEGNMFNHTLLTLEKAEGNLDLLYAMLFHDIGKPAVPQKVRKDEGWVISTKGHPVVSAEVFKLFAEKFKFPRQSKELILWLIINHEVRPFVNMDDSQRALMALDPRFELLLKVWEADFAGNIRLDKNDDYTKVVRDGINLGIEFLHKIKNSEKLIHELAKGEIVMKYSKLRPGKDLGLKIGEIKNEQNLKEYLGAV